MARSSPSTTSTARSTRPTRVCTHAFADLADGTLDGDVITCALHFGAFHVPTGKAMEAPCFTDLKTFKTDVKDGQVLVDLSSPAATAG